MPFNDETIQTGSNEPKNKVYVKGIVPGLNKSNPFFEVNNLDGTKSEHKTMQGMKFISAEPHVYTTEEWGDKQQIHIVLNDEDGTRYDLYANWNSITRQMYNAIAGSKNIDTISIMFNYNGVGEYTGVSVFIDGSNSPTQWAFSGDDYHGKVAKTMISGKEVKDYTELDAAITERIVCINKGLQNELEEMEQATTKKETKPKKETDDDTSLPF